MATSTIQGPSIITDDFSKSNVTINANSNADVDFDVAKTGYRTLGVILISKSGSGSGTCVIVSFALLSNGNVRINIRNTYSSGASLTVGCRVLYQRL